MTDQNEDSQSDRIGDHRRFLTRDGPLRAPPPRRGSTANQRGGSAVLSQLRRMVPDQEIKDSNRDREIAFYTVLDLL